MKVIATAFLLIANLFRAATGLTDDLPSIRDFALLDD
jgi:hypothetical protein